MLPHYLAKIRSLKLR